MREKRSPGIDKPSSTAAPKKGPLRVQTIINKAALLMKEEGLRNIKKQGLPAMRDAYETSIAIESIAFACGQETEDPIRMGDLFPFTQYGSISVNYSEPLRDRETVAAITSQDSSYVYNLKRNEELMEMHFTPFVKAERGDDLVLESMYLGVTDFTNLISSRIGEPNMLIVGVTNPTMARFAAKHVGFHLADETTMNTFRIRDNEDDAELIFAESKDIFTEIALGKLQSIRSGLHKRALSSGKTKATTEAEYEKEVLDLGIRLHLKSYREYKDQNEEFFPSL
jgi:hypothetical protein